MSLWATAARPKYRQAPGSAATISRIAGSGRCRTSFPRGCEADPSGLVGKRRGLPKPRAGAREMGDIGPALARRDRDREVAGHQPIHAAGRIADGIDHRSGRQPLQFASVEHGLAKRRRSVAEPTVLGDDVLRQSAFRHGPTPARTARGKKPSATGEPVREKISAFFTE